MHRHTVVKFLITVAVAGILLLAGCQSSPIEPWEYAPAQPVTEEAS